MDQRILCNPNSNNNSNAKLFHINSRKLDGNTSGRISSPSSGMILRSVNNSLSSSTLVPSGLVLNNSISNNLLENNNDTISNSSILISNSILNSNNILNCNNSSPLDLNSNNGNTRVMAGEVNSPALIGGGSGASLVSHYLPMSPAPPPIPPSPPIGVAGSPSLTPSPSLTMHGKIISLMEIL